MISASSWAPNRLDVFGLGNEFGMYHKAWNGSSWNSNWDSLGGRFVSSPTVASWGPNRLEVFGVGLDGSVYHQFWNGSSWGPAWATLGGKLVSPPTVVSWGPGRLDVFGMGLDGAYYHRSWNGSSWEPALWENLGGIFLSPPSVVAWGPNRLDIIGMGLDGAYYHRCWNGSTWEPSVWENLGGKFQSPPSVVAWGPNRLDIFGMGMDGAYYHRCWNGSAWEPSLWESLGGKFQSRPMAVAWGSNRLDILGVGMDGAIYHRCWNGSSWQPNLWEKHGGDFVSAPAVVSWGSNRLDVFGVGTDQAIYHLSWNGSSWQPAGQWENLGGAFALDAVTPPSGLGSNSNYILASGGNNLRGLVVRIRVTQDIVCQSASGPITGFGFQLNCYSPKNQLSAWQQYVFSLFGTQVVVAVDNWPLSGDNIINDFINLNTLPNNTLPAGHSVEIALGTDASNNIVSATYRLADPNGNVIANQTVDLLSISSPNDVAPIVAFELNLVGPVNGESSVLSSGAGTIEYICSTPLTPLSVEPSYAESGYITAETANSFYGWLGAAAANEHIQTFQISQIDTERPMIQRKGKLRPHTAYRGLTSKA
jgi:hypothetical protein